MKDWGQSIQCGAEFQSYNHGRCLDIVFGERHVEERSGVVERLVVGKDPAQGHATRYRIARATRPRSFIGGGD